MTVQFDLFNAFNANDATAITARSGPNYDRITAILPPRVARRRRDLLVLSHIGPAAWRAWRCDRS